MEKLFISYIHEDDKHIELLKSIKNNNNNSINFSDSSLVKPILNEHGHINKKPPSNPKSEDVRECIKHLLRNSNKLLVLIGKDTHSSEWVKWEIETYFLLKNQPDILLMRVPYEYQAGSPSCVKHLPVIDWNVDYLDEWINNQKEI